MPRNPLLQTVQTARRSKPAGRRFLSFLASAFLQTGVLAGVTLFSIVAVRALPGPPDMATVLPTRWIPVIPPSDNVTRHEATGRDTTSSGARVLLDKAFIMPTTIPIETFDEGLADFERATANAGIDVPGIAGGIPGGLPPPPRLPIAKAMPEKRIRIGGDIRAPQKTVHVDPVYPAIAVRGRVEGFVILEAIIDATGNVEGARVLRSVPLLDKAAVDAVRQWKYEPTRLNGRPVPIVMTVTVRFVLDR